MKFLTISQAGNILKQGGIIAFPTETVYGLGAVASNGQAVEKIYKAKHRPADNPLICHFYSINQIKTYVKDMPEIVELLFKHFSPGPLSILLNLPENSPLAPATRGSDTVICRIPDHPLALELVKEVGEPLAAPSANTSGKMSGTTAEVRAVVTKEEAEKIDEDWSIFEGRHDLFLLEKERVISERESLRKKFGESLTWS
jgi:L-threonylcarbamoyladenylate synthase